MIIRAKAPLRLGLAGGGTDVSPYCDEYGGYVLNVTIDMYSYCTIIPRFDGMIHFEATDRNESVLVNAQPFLELSDSLPLHKAVYNYIVKNYNNGAPLSLSMTTFSDAPAGSGLGSSSTMVVVMVKAFQEWLNLPFDDYDIARIAYAVERNDVGLSGGKQDQYAATFGGLNFIEFYSENRVIVNQLRIKNWIRNELESSLLLYYTGTSRDSARIIDEQVKNTVSKQTKSIEGMHELKEFALIMKESVLKGDFDGFNECILQGWEAKKKTASIISNPEIEEIYKTIIENGGKSAKISGAGGGGFMMIVIDPTKREQLIRVLTKRNGYVRTVKFVEKGSEAWTIY